jgi:hypothetical protein
VTTAHCQIGRLILKKKKKERKKNVEDGVTKFLIQGHLSIQDSLFFNEKLSVFKHIKTKFFF